MLGCCFRGFIQGVGHVSPRTFQSSLRQSTCFPAISVAPNLTGILGVRYAGKPNLKQPKQKHVLPSYRIGVTKGWDSIHTGSLKGSYWASDRMLDDIMIRKFVVGVMYDFLESSVVIKRKANCIRLVFLVTKKEDLIKLYFLIGFTEKLLTELLGCTVKIDAQSSFHK